MHKICYTIEGMTVLSRLGTLDSFSLGFAVVHRRPWLIALPLLLNLFLWLGPGLTIGPLAEDWRATYERILQENPNIASMQGASVEDMQTVAGQIAEAAAQVNLLRMLAFLTPSLPFDRTAADTGPVIADGGTLFLSLVGLFLAGLAIAAVYLTAVAETVRNDGAVLPRVTQRAGTNWLHLFGYYALLLGLSLPLFIGFTMFLAVARLFSDVLASLFLSLCVGLFMLAQFYMFFVPSAIFFARAGPVQALWQSAQVMGRFFWSSLWFIMLNWVLSTGFTIVFSRLFDFGAITALVGILGYAYIATGLTAAAMVFFQNRALLIVAARDPAQRLSAQS